VLHEETENENKVEEVLNKGVGERSVRCRQEMEGCLRRVLITGSDFDCATCKWRDLVEGNGLIRRAEQPVGSKIRHAAFACEGHVQAKYKSLIGAFA
jgi:hypothetical protein